MPLCRLSPDPALFLVHPPQHQFSNKGESEKHLGEYLCHAGKQDARIFSHSRLRTSSQIMTVKKKILLPVHVRSLHYHNILFSHLFPGHSLVPLLGKEHPFVEGNVQFVVQQKVVCIRGHFAPQPGIERGEIGSYSVRSADRK